jgi:hypothetical protein
MSAQKRYNELMSAGKSGEAEEFAKLFKQKYNLDIDTNVDDITTELDVINDKINGLDDKHIQVAMDWDGIDEIENGMR